jgi:GT2 family glycosyltransferase
MSIDIVFVTYNSSKWIDGCIKAISRSNFDLKEVNLFFVDNNSIDDTIELLNKNKSKYSTYFGAFEIIPSTKNLGFGKGNNLGATKGVSPLVFFLNIDTELDQNALQEIQDEAQKNDQQIGAFELRQFPYEHPKYYDPITGFTSWASGAALVVTREVFETIGGFSKKLFMYAEDVDLSWRIQLLDKKVKYIPKAVVNHYSYAAANEVKPTQYLFSILNNLFLRCTFGSFRDIIKGFMMYLQVMKHRGPFERARSILLKEFIKMTPKYISQLFWNLSHRKKINSVEAIKFIDWDFTIRRTGDFYQSSFPKETPLASIIVRTCQRPDTLRETLISLRNQTYKNLEIVIVEDGPSESEEMIRTEFSDLNTVYRSTETRQGRSFAGNLGMSTAKGKYLNFLDDDDLFFADHVENLINEFQINIGFKLIYTNAFETAIDVQSKSPYKYTVGKCEVVHARWFNLATLCAQNYIPIQTIMFEKAVFDDMGGFDESLDFLEDWNLWVKYASKYPFKYIAKTTSLYRVPLHPEVNSERQIQLDSTLQRVYKMHEELPLHYLTAGELGNQVRV